jgi:Aldehyde dehydrogenase family
VSPPAGRVREGARDIGRIWRVAEALEYGIVGINEGIISTEIAPFGGIKESGIGPTLWSAHNDERSSGFQQGRCGCRSLRDAANLENEHAGACYFDYDRKDGEQRLGGQFCSRQPKRCEQGIADH